MKNYLVNSNYLINSYMEARKGCSWKYSIQHYEYNLLKNIRRAQKELEEGSYKQQDFYCFYLKERGKDRYIRSITFYDRVIQRALCDLLVPVVNPYLIYDNGASLKGKGIDFARRRIVKHLSNYYRRYGNKGYVLMIDFSKFYDNIMHKPLMDMYKRIIDEQFIIDLIEHLVNSFSFKVYESNNLEMNDLYDSLIYSRMPKEDRFKILNKSLGIGSQISQISGIYYPTEIDNFIKIVCGIKYYGRYMDDTYIISNNKEELQRLYIEIQKICDKLGIFINTKKTQIYRIDKGFTFLKIKYRITESGRIMRIPVKKNFVRERRKLKSFKKLLDNNKMTLREIEEQYGSWRGNLVKFDCHNSLLNMDRLFYSLFYKK